MKIQSQIRFADIVEIDGSCIYQGNGKRVLILSNDIDNSDNENPTILAIPRSSVMKPGRMAVYSYRNEGGCDLEGVFIYTHFIPITKSQLSSYQGTISRQRFLYLVKQIKQFLYSNININTKGGFKLGEIVKLGYLDMNLLAVVVGDSIVSEYGEYATIVYMDLRPKEIKNYSSLINVDRSCGEIIGGDFVVLPKTIRSLDVNAARLSALDSERGPIYVSSDTLNEILSAIMCYITNNQEVGVLLEKKKHSSLSDGECWAKRRTAELQHLMSPLDNLTLKTFQLAEDTFVKEDNIQTHLVNWGNNLFSDLSHSVRAFWNDMYSNIIEGACLKAPVPYAGEPQVFPSSIVVSQSGIEVFFSYDEGEWKIRIIGNDLTELYQLVLLYNTHEIYENIISWSDGLSISNEIVTASDRFIIRVVD